MTEQDSGNSEGQAPAAGEGQPQGDGQQQPPVGNGSQLTPEQTAVELARARSEAANYRTQLRDAQGKLQTYEQGKLTETERYQARIKELETQNSTLQSEVTSVRTQAGITAAATKLGFRNPAVAHKLLDAASIQYDDKGQPQNVEQLLGDLVKQEPYLTTHGTADGGAGRKDGGQAKDMNSLIRGAIGRQ